MGLVISIATEKYLERELSFVEVLNRVTDTTKYRQIKVVYITHENYGISLLDFDYKGLDRKFIMSESYKNAQSVLYKAFN